MEREKREEREAMTRLKTQQRAEVHKLLANITLNSVISQIYALNKVMAEFERLKFESVMSGKV
jgi:hypothetical protein